MKLAALEFKILRDFEDLLVKNLGHPRHVCLVLQVSGGKDSMALLNVVHSILKSDLRKFTTDVYLVVQHFNHKRRGEASDGDAHFVEEQCRQLKVPFFLEVATEDQFEGSNFQEGARDWRRTSGLERAKRVAREQKSDCYLILTAHHARDTVESMLMNILRGSGVAGLCGIRAFEQSWWRPFANIRSQELMSYIVEKKIEFREDASNFDLAYKRNSIRHSVLPSLEEIAPHMEKAFLRLSENAREVCDALNARESNKEDERTVSLQNYLTPGELLRAAWTCDPELRSVLSLNAAKNILHEHALIKIAAQREIIGSNGQENTVKKIPLRKNWVACLSKDRLVFYRNALENKETRV